MMYVTTLIVYVPPISTFLGDNVVLPGQIWRLAWPVQLAAILTLGWLVWTVTDYAAEWLRSHGPARFLAGALPILLVVALTAAAVPQARQGMESIQAHREANRKAGFFPPDSI